MSSEKQKQWSNQARVTQSFEAGLCANSQNHAMGFPAPEKTDLVCGCFPRRKKKDKWFKYHFGKRWQQAYDHSNPGSP